MKQLDEQTVLQRLRSDDRQVLRQIFEAHYASVCTVIRRFIADPGLVEDLAQEVFVRFWEKRHRIEINSNLPAYIRRMAVNEALAYLRKKNRFAPDELPQQLPHHTTAGADQALEASELQAAIRQAINSLPPRCKLIFQLSRFEDLTYREIAQKLDISEKTVENQMGKALKNLRDQLRQYTSALAWLALLEVALQQLIR